MMMMNNYCMYIVQALQLPGKTGNWQYRYLGVPNGVQLDVELAAESHWYTYSF